MTNSTYKKNFELIYSLNGISSVWLKMLEFIHTQFPDVPDSFLNLLVIYFSLLDDGNTCLVLEPDYLKEKWGKKWLGLVIAEQKDSDSAYSIDSFDSVIEEGLKDLEELTSPALKTLIGEEKDKLFTIEKVDGRQCLFARKYFDSKLVIENKLVKIFNSDKQVLNSKTALLMQEHIKSVSNITLNDKQVEALTRGLEESLIITGGPGTGKTTVVSYLLWELLKKDCFKNCNLYLAAPSGKASDRMKESILEALGSLSKEEIDLHRDIYEKLVNTEAKTIHRLLSYSAKTGGFDFNENNRFPENSVFVIDEASMIDIVLFKNLLQAISDDSRVFLLGDKNQLPSVQAGAVLGDILAAKKDSVVELVQSNRFNDHSQVGILANSMQNNDVESYKSQLDFVKFDEWKSIGPGFPKDVQKGINPVSFIEVENKEISSLVTTFAKAYYSSLYEKACDLDVESPNLDALNDLWSLSVSAKILCAERNGSRGIININKVISQHILQVTGFKTTFEDSHYPGELLMIDENLKELGLFNGDCGVVVTVKTRKTKYLIIKKDELESSKTDTNSMIFNVGPFVFYPLYVFPVSSIETAYAITIHKSQGSGYNSIMVFMPNKEGHPLLNRQILYTAITRTKGYTCIVSDQKSMITAKNTIIERDTGIRL